MKKQILKIKKKYACSTSTIEKAIVYAYIMSCGINCNPEGVICSFIGDTAQIIHISEEIGRLNLVSTLDDLIYVFEILVENLEKKNKGIVYTPAKIRNYICNRVICGNNIKKVIDPSCGCGAFLVSAAIRLKKIYNISYEEICHSYLYGCDIDKHSIDKAIVLLNVLSLQDDGIELGNIDNLIVANSLDLFSENKFKSQFDIVIGNPPYVRTKNIDESVKKSLENWNVVTGNVDLYIPFYQLGIELLKDNGKLGYISPNTFLQSVNGRGLRNYIRENRLGSEIINFKDEQAFNGVTHYTCIVIIDKDSRCNKAVVTYSNCKTGNLKELTYTDYDISNYKVNQEWRFGNSQVDSLIYKVEHQPHKLNDYGIKNGLATLANEVFFFSMTNEDELYYYRTYKNYKYKIEKEICIDVAKPNIMRDENDLITLGEKAIFPYHDGKIINEDVLKNKYPCAYAFLLKQRDLLMRRDKGNTSKYPAWYAYGRTQGMNNYGKKLLVPYMADKGVAILSENEKLLFYCGYALFSNDITVLKLLKALIESNVFLFYIKMTSKPYSKGFVALAKNYIKNFGVPELDTYQIQLVLNYKSEERERYISKLYGIDYDEIIGALKAVC